MHRMRCDMWKAYICMHRLISCEGGEGTERLPFLLADRNECNESLIVQRISTNKILCLNSI